MRFSILALAANPKQCKLRVVRVPTPDVTDVLVDRFALAFPPVKQRDAAQGGWTRTGNQPGLKPEVIHRLPFHRKHSDLQERLVHGRFIDRAEYIDSSVAKVPINSTLRRGSEV